MRFTLRSPIARLALVALLGVLVGCGAERGSAAATVRPKVAVSIFPLFDVTRRVAGERFEVLCVLPPGTTEHSYDPGPREVASFSDTALAIGVGLELDTWLQRIVRGVSPRARFLELGPSLDPRRMTAPEVGVLGHDHDHDHGHAHGGPDPHFWLDPRRMERAVDAIVEALVELDPDGAAGLRARGEAEKAALRELDAAIEAASRRWRKREIVTFHGSFGYFAERYGLRVVAVVEPFPGREPSPRYVREVVDALGRAEAAALFYEPQLDPRPARVIAREAGRPIFELDPLGGGPGRESYEALLRYDVSVLDEALR
ncbi:MAG: zinc ABC transporter substrate-binding protein [Myxococcales bacterium]|nr:zinc ABC transporter substrate-binding protein [Myxococcales bacterium]